MALHYAVRSVEDALGQLWTLFGWTFLLSWAMWHTSQGMRKLGSKWLGMGYFYLVAPGVACHETGHLLGCWLTRSKVTEYVPFRPQPDGNLGWVNHLVSNTMLGKASLFVTGTGPIWFGGAVALVLSWMLTGTGAREMFGEVPGAGGGAMEYMLAVKTGALALAERVFSPGE